MELFVVVLNSFKVLSLEFSTLLETHNTKLKCVLLTHSRNLLSYKYNQIVLTYHFRLLYYEMVFVSEPIHYDVLQNLHNSFVS